MLPLDAVWGRLKKRQGQAFETKKGRPFTYEIVGDVLHPSRTSYNISKREFGKALPHVQCDGPGAISDLVRGPCYVWALLHDKRVRGDDW